MTVLGVGKIPENHMEKGIINSERMFNLNYMGGQK